MDRRWSTKAVRLAAVIAVLLQPALPAGQALSDPQHDESPVTYITFQRNFGRNKQINIHVLRVKLNETVTVKLALARDRIGRLERTSGIARRNNAVAAVNGTFFDNYRPYLPIGLIVIDGNMVMKSLLNRTAVGISKKHGVRFGVPRFTGHIVNEANGEKIPVWGINRPRKQDETIIYTPEYGWRTRTNRSGSELIVEDDIVVGLSEGDSPIPRNGYVISFHGWSRKFANTLPPGSRLSSSYKLSDGWDRYEQVITGGPRLLENGRDVVIKSIDRENFRSEVYGKKARTAIGLCGGNELVLVVVEGRANGRRSRRFGINYSEMMQLMKDLGAKEAMGLDGGGSSTMVVDGAVVNWNAIGNEQGVSNAIIVK